MEANVDVCHLDNNKMQAIANVKILGQTNEVPDEDSIFSTTYITTDDCRIEICKISEDTISFGGNAYITGSVHSLKSGDSIHHLIVHYDGIIKFIGFERVPFLTVTMYE